MEKRLVTCGVLAAALWLAGCGGGEEPTPTPTKTPAAAAATTALPPPAPPTAAPQAPAEPTAQPAQAPAAQPEPAQPAATPTPVVEQVATVTADQLNIRSEPSTSGTIVKMAPAGQSFVVVGRSEDGLWLQLAENGAPVGWAVAEYLTVAERAVAAAPAAGGQNATQPAAAEPDQPVAAGSFAPATMNSPDFGSQAFLWWRPEMADNDLNLLKNGGFNWVKQTFAWETIEGAGRGHFDWTVADRVVSQVNSKGLKLLARLSIDPDKRDFWAGTPPGNGDAFAEYAGAIAARYNCQPGAVGCIQAFQVWNEPNLGREWGSKRPNPAEYAEFLRKAYTAIKAANPSAIVVSAGMAPTGDNNDAAMPDDMFYDQLYQAMGGNSNGYFDALGVHGAGYAAPPELNPQEAADNPKYGGYRFFSFRHVEDIRGIMEKYGDNAKKIVLLEFGWTSDEVNPAYKWHGADAGITEEVKADYLKRAYQFAAQNWPWVGLMSLLTMPNPDWLNDGNAKDEEQYWWAIMRVSQEPQNKWRPAYMVLCIYFNELRGQTCQYAPKE